MKRRLSLLLASLLILASASAACAVDIAYVRMSGIPGTMTKIGQTCSLTAIVYYQDGTLSWTESMTWESSNPSVARVDQYGNVVSLRQGTTIISVTTTAVGPNGLPASDYAALNVTDQLSYTNIHPDVWARLRLYNANMSQYDEQLNFADANPANVATQSFQSNFTGKFGVSASQVTEISDAGSVAFDSRSSFGTGVFSAIKPSMKISVSSLAPKGGSLLPLELTYSLSWQEVSDILGRNVTTLADGGELFERIGLVFEDERGVAVSVIDRNSYSRAISGGALLMASGNKGLTLTLKVMLADVTAKTANRAEWIEDCLVVPDGEMNGTSGGSMWLVKNSGGTQDAGSGGGGGCDAGIGGIFFAIVGMSLGLRFFASGWRS